MHFDILWSDEDRQVLLVNSSGQWDAMQITSQWNEVLAHAPRYMIWDITNMIVVPETYEWPELGSERESAVSKLVNFMRQPEFKQFYIIAKTKHLVFDTLQETAQVYQFDAKLQFVSSVEAALEMIQTE